MRMATKSQLTKIRHLMNKTGYIEQESRVIITLTNGRTQFANELYFNEASELIKQLFEYAPEERLKDQIFSLAFKIGFIYGSSDEDKRMNVAKINSFLKNKGYSDKELKEMNYSELQRVLRRFKQLWFRSQNYRDELEAEKAINNLLNELHLNRE